MIRLLPKAHLWQFHRGVGMDDTNPGQPELCICHSGDADEPHRFWSSFPNPKRKRNVQDKAGLGTLVSKAPEGVAVDAAFGLGQYFNFFILFLYLFFKKHCSNLLIYCITLGREITRFLFFYVNYWVMLPVLEQAFKMPFVGCCGFFCFVLLNPLANCHGILTPASSALCSLSVINYQNWLEFVLLSSQKKWWNTC